MKDLSEFRAYLTSEEKSRATTEKYLRDVGTFLAFVQERPMSKQLVLDYKQDLVQKGYSPTSVNSMLASVNAWLRFTGQEQMKARQLKIQRALYCPAEKELSRREYFALVQTAVLMGEESLSLILQTICATGIRVSELEYVTVEAVKRGTAVVNCKGKLRTVFLVSALCRQLDSYITRRSICTGPVFVRKSGKPINRNVIWRRMKRLCRYAGVDPQKVYPHNLRHLFAREYYESEKDLAKLADILGHSSINTTRIYICSTGTEHQRQLEKLELVL